MAKLLHNERVKLYKKPSTWVLSGILVALMLFSVVFVKIISLVSESARYDVMDWQEVYQQDLASMQMALENNPGDPYMRAQIQWYEYLLDEEIPPGDWRNDPSYSYFTALVAEEDAEAALEAAPGDPSLEEQAARYREEAAYYKAVLEQKDWKGYLHMQIERLKKGEAIDGSQSAETQKERDVQIEILQMQIDLGIEPVSSQNNLYYYGGVEEPSDGWKRSALSALQTNKLALLRGEASSEMGGEAMPLTESGAAKLEQENAVLTERLRTNTPPIEEDSFLGMLDSTTGSLNLTTLLIMVLAGGLIAGEFGTGTVKLLLITPHRRQKIYWAKAVLLLEMTGIILGAMFVLSFLSSAIFCGFGGIGDMQVLNLLGRVVRVPALLVIVVKYLLYMLPVIAYGSLAFMLSAVTRRSAVAIAVSLLLMYGGQTAMLILIAGSVSLLGAPLPGLKFLLFANENLSVYLPETSSIFSMVTGQIHLSTWDATMNLGFSVAVLLIYTVCFLWIGRDSFCRRDVK